MSGIVIVVVVLALVMAATLVVSVFVLRRVGDKAERRADDLRSDVERLGERWVIPLGGAAYQGGAAVAGRSKGHGVLGLTDRRVLFLPIAGETVGIPRARVAGVRIEDRRREAASDHRHRLVLTLDDGAVVAFLVDDPATWERALAGRGSPGAPGELEG